MHIIKSNPRTNINAYTSLCHRNFAQPPPSSCIKPIRLRFPNSRVRKYATSSSTLPYFLKSHELFMEAWVGERVHITFAHVLEVLHNHSWEANLFQLEELVNEHTVLDEQDRALLRARGDITDNISVQ
ncbi:hypothetical protein QQ045_016171 [Rhodiola kirilowii]